MEVGTCQVVGRNNRCHHVDDHTEQGKWKARKQGHEAEMALVESFSNSLVVAHGIQDGQDLLAYQGNTYEATTEFA